MNTPEALPPGPVRPGTVPDLEKVGAREVLNALPDAAYITDTERRIVFWSRTAERITGWSATEVVGHRCSDNILVHVDKDGHQLCKEDSCPLHRAIVTGHQSTHPLLVFAQHRDGHRIPVEVSVAPLRDRQGATIGGIEVFRDSADMMQELRRAKIIQEHVLRSDLIPDNRLSVDVMYRPEEMVGGDFYRIQRLDADRYAVMVADIMGHGVASALYTMQFRAIWDECQAQLDAPALFMRNLNRRLLKLAGPDGYFATAVFLLLDVDSRQLRYVRAGHPPPLRLRAGGGIEELNAHSPAVGLMEEPSFEEATVPMSVGDGLLLFTDGAIELVNRAGEDLGQAGFIHLLEGLGDRRLDLPSIEKRLLEFTNDIRLPDDLTLLSLRLQ